MDIPLSRRRALLLGPIYVALTFCAILTLVPFAWLICAAFKTNADVFAHNFLPMGDGFLGVAWDRLTVANFERLFTELGIGRAIANSVMLSAVSALVATFFCALGGYALAKFNFKGRSFILSLVLASLVIPGSLLMAPGYKLIHDLGLLDTYAGLLLPGISPAFGIFLFRQAMVNAAPTALIESARIDGAGELRIFFTIILPLVRPMVGAYLMITFLGSWNNFIGPQIILQDPSRFPLSVAINQLRGMYGTDYGLIMSGTLVSIAPVLALFLLLQKEFISGLTSGAVKG
ncbi:MAG: carbohydrate ABC transporter permease [Opitutaceae bacterium]|jgi:ABC-type glycerol-3-phosphate transport system permease component|nr:carbohydrate ABC transporter permease [Opitutaceae bacterium]